MASETQKSTDESLFGFKNYLSLDNTFRWITILLSLILVLNFLFLCVYHQQAIETKPNQSFFVSIWTYFGSDAFNYVTITLLLPILVLFIENLFEVRKNVNERINERRKSAEERREKERQSSIDARWKLIEKTSNSYIDFFNSISDLAHFQKSNNEASKEEKKGTEKKNEITTDIRKKLDKHVNSINSLFNEWYNMFPNLNANDGNLCFQDHVCYLINVLLNSAGTISIYIDRSNDSKELDELRHTIATIQNFLQGHIYHNTLNVLKMSILVWEGSFEKDSQKIVKANSEINLAMKNLNNIAKHIMHEEMQNNELLSNVEGEEREDFCKSVKKIITFTQANPHQDHKESEEYKKSIELFEKIKHEQLATSTGFYSIEWVRLLSDQLFLQIIFSKIDDRIEMIRGKIPNKMV